MPGPTRRQAVGGLAVSAAVLGGRARAAGEYRPSDRLIAAARKEGRLVLYTAAYVEVEQEVINLFNKSFPFVKVELVRASGGQLITRVRSEAAAGKLIADIVDHSDPSLMAGMAELFQDYVPPNADEYRPETVTAGKMWPVITPPWTIIYNREIVKNPPRTWMDLCKPEYGDGQIGTVIAASGGSTWARIMFERLVLGENYWVRQAATRPKLFPSGAPLADAVVRGEVPIGVVVHNAILAMKRDGAPVDVIFPPEGVPVLYNATAIPKTAANPNAARLYIDWKLSREGQIDSILKHGNLSSMKVEPAVPPGFDPNVAKVWVPDFQKYAPMHDKWIEEWNQIYGYRQ